ncbi:hypothetical protein PoB_004507100 [Plakobranchus ocellatus]|uniref:Uncharacterized protein n=1 Tax=Plakobranchus ocellatus TaxID=259542 RepID=A0AAV4B5A4_9GAST|nr:hypothetical protein PoB_004507100 [Plakobranchus ocellatus]
MNGSYDSSGRAVGYQVRSPSFESQSGPNQFIIASPCPSSTKWLIAWFICIASQQKGDLKLLGPPSGQGAGSKARTRDRRVPTDFISGSLSTDPPTPFLQ